jgi:hypothetical protein
MKLPLLNIPDVPLVAASQAHLPLADITEDLLLYKDGGAAIIMESTSLNFSLLSEREQQAVIAAYAALINSLSFSVQIAIRTKRKDISSYMQSLEETAKKITNPKLANLMQGYKRFILDSIKKKNVLGKKFYLVIPFSTLELGISKTLASTTKRKGPLPFPKSYIVKKAQVALFPKRDHLIRQAGRLGLKLRQLNTAALIELFYDIYNPEPPSARKDTQALNQ